MPLRNYWIYEQRVVEECIRQGIEEFCVAPGSRNAPLVYALSQSDRVKVYYWSEERSAAFFALGRIKATEKPVAVVTTSGTAAAELLPATMSGYYLGFPLLLITADRPRRFRNTGAPQTAEQEGLFGCYARYEVDLASNELICLDKWYRQGPAHINMCFEEPSEKECLQIKIRNDIQVEPFVRMDPGFDRKLDLFIDFIEKTKAPFVVIGSLPLSCKEAAVRFLLQLNAPIYAEGPSHLREDIRLEHLRIKSIDLIWEQSRQNGYEIDGILRIGEIPTARLWRDLEDKASAIKICSVSELPFSGLSRGGLLYTSLEEFFDRASHLCYKDEYCFKHWQEADQEYAYELMKLYREEPQAEPALFHFLSCRLSERSNVYLGNSLPVREWDLAATYENRNYEVYASRGVNGIDGQISTFLGLCRPETDNWAILGDLTVLYDMAGPWILSQMSRFSVNIVIINNGGGQIFTPMYAMPEFINPHTLQFRHFAEFWKLHYEMYEEIPNDIGKTNEHRLIELVPDMQATRRFWKKAAELRQSYAR